MTTIALDAMGGDHGPSVVIPAAVTALSKHSTLNLILVGREEILSGYLSQIPGNVRDRVRIHHASQEVEMCESPASALRGKKDSSMRVSINLVKEGAADAIVSAGNTGALMATARFVLKTLPGIDRPAICTAVPSLTGHTHVLDLGANVDCTAEHLLQFAVMGSELVAAISDKRSPTVGLLNIGEEEMKGNGQVQEAAKLLANAGLNYIGFVEGNDIYNGKVDIVVTDGFVGNVALKASEGIAKLIIESMRCEFKRNLLTKLAGLVAMPVLKAFKHRIDPRTYNGASLLGLKQIVIKSHGGADELSFSNAISVAVLEVEQDVPQHIGKHVAELLNRQEAV